MNYFHISLYKPRDAAGVHGGGVEVFAGYLQRAVPDMKLLSFPDFPDWKEHFDARTPDYDKAAILNGWLMREGIVGIDDVVVTDGYWGRGLEGKVGRLISVVHGTYFGRLLQSQIHPWGEIVGMDHIENQMGFFADKRVEVVSVARECVNELRAYGIRDKTKVIYHGVDLDVYKPLHEDKGLFMYGATSNRKGLDIIKALMALLPDHPIDAMNEYSCIPEKKANRLNDAMCLLAPTRHEGNAYLLIEALACGVPLIAFRTGLACEMDERCGHITDDIAPKSFVRLMHKAEYPPEGFEGYDPRGWVEENCDFETFAAEWRTFLDLS